MYWWLNLLTTNVPYNIENYQLICSALVSKWRGALVDNGLKGALEILAGSNVQLWKYLSSNIERSILLKYLS